jgi:hypothetical protein
MGGTAQLDPLVSPLLRIPAADVTSQRPFWHRPDPLVAVTRIDPGHAVLRERFPRSWQHLVRAKTLVDGMTSLEAPAAVPEILHRRRIAPLLTAAAEELARCGEAEDAGLSRTVGAQARAAAHRLSLFARSGEWQPLVLRPPAPGEPWLYCGPLGTWAMHAARTPLGFLLVSPRRDLQAEPDAIDADIRAVRAVVAGALGGAIRSTKDPRPAMQITDLILAGGEPVSGHKHFAHFFPLETPASSVDTTEFTIVFSNVHASRLRRCSLELLKRCAPGQRERGDVLRASIAWFRGHDLAHFWRLAGAADDSTPDIPLTAFERITLEETYADVIGLMSAAALGRRAALSQAFAAELLRYLSCECSLFADSCAAALTIGWLSLHGVTREIGTEEWLSAALPPLGQLGRAIHRVMWEGSDQELDGLRAALMAGRQFSAGRSDLFHSVPTDIEYVFG